MMEDAMKTIGSDSHPTARKIVRKQISTGMVMRNKVVITSRLLACGEESRLNPSSGDIIIAAAWRVVEIRDMAIEPTAPGRPLMITASRAKPL